MLVLKEDFWKGSSNPDRVRTSMTGKYSGHIFNKLNGDKKTKETKIMLRACVCRNCRRTKWPM